jgi:hypothetical protein
VTEPLGPGSARFWAWSLTERSVGRRDRIVAPGATNFVVGVTEAG